MKATITKQHFETYVDEAEAYLQGLQKLWRAHKTTALKKLYEEIIKACPDMKDAEWDWCHEKLFKSALNTGMFIRFKNMCKEKISFAISQGKKQLIQRVVVIRIAMYVAIMSDPYGLEWPFSERCWGVKHYPGVQEGLRRYYPDHVEMDLCKMFTATPTPLYPLRKTFWVDNK